MKSPVDEVLDAAVERLLELTDEWEVLAEIEARLETLRDLFRADEPFSARDHTIVGRLNTIRKALADFIALRPALAAVASAGGDADPGEIRVLRAKLVRLRSQAGKAAIAARIDEEIRQLDGRGPAAAPVETGAG